MAIASLGGTALLSLCLAAAPPAPAPTLRDAGDDDYRFLAGLIDKGMFEMAVDEAKAFLREHPNHGKTQLARYRLATALFELDREEEALPHFEALAESHGFEYRAESAFRLGQCLLNGGRVDEARASLRTVLELDQEYLHGPATFFLAEAEFRRGAYDEAEAGYRALVRRHADSEYGPAARRGLVWCAWERRDARQTIERAREFLSASAGGEEADEIRVVLGEAHLEAEEGRRALEAFSSVESVAFGDERRRGLGFAHLALGDHAGATREFRALLEEYPDSRFAREARLQLGIALLRSGDAEGAVRALRAADVEDSPEALLWLAEAHEAAGDLDRALRTLERALSLRPDAPLEARLQVARGEVLTGLGRTRDALAAFERAGSDYALYAAAVAALNEGEAPQAARLVRKLLESHPETPYRAQALHVLGEARFAEAEYADAARAFERVLTEAEPPLAARALARLGWCAYLTGDLASAADRFRRLQQNHPGEPVAEEGLYMLARVLAEAGDGEAAVEAGARYLERHPGGAHADEVLLTSARAAGADEGVELLETLVSEHGGSPLVPQALVDLGDRLSAAEDCGRAAGYYEAVLRDHAESELVPEAAYGLAWCRYREDRFEESARLLEQVGQLSSAGEELRQAAWELCVFAAARAEDPARATEAWRRFASACDDDARRFESVRSVVAAWRDAGRPADGQHVLDELLRLVDDEAVAIEILLEGAYLALEEGDVDRADAQVQVARRRAPESARIAEAAFFVGEARFERGDRARAITLFESAAAEGSPMRAEAAYKLGFARLQDEDHPGAAQAFGAVVDGHPQHELWGESLFLLGESLYRSADWEPAAATLERLRAEAPEHEVLPRALFRLGLAYGELERWGPCEAVLAELARRDPEFPNRTEAELWRGRALAAQRKERAARQAFERVLANDRGELAARARLGLGGLLEAEGRLEEALSEYLKVALLYAHDEEVAEGLYRAGTCLEALDDPERALERYEEVLAQHPETTFAAAARSAVQRLANR